MFAYQMHIVINLMLASAIMTNANGAGIMLAKGAPVPPAVAVFLPEPGQDTCRDRTGPSQGRYGESLPQTTSPAVVTAGDAISPERRGFEPRIRI